MDSLSRHGLLILSIFSLLRGPFASADRSPGCYSHTIKPVEWNATAGDIKIFQVNGRQVRVTIPPIFNSTKPAPMIIAFHDKDQTMEQLEYEGAFMDGQVNTDNIMVYPAPENERWTSDISPLKKKTGEKPANSTEDIQFAQYLMKDLQDLLCVDTSRIYAAGLGTGGGMMHMLACNKMLSSQIAAFAAVAGAFGSGKKGQRPWGSCRANRTVPIAEIHGLDDRIYGYYLNEGENGKMRKIPGHWLEEWADRNQCGDAVGETQQSTQDEATFVTRLENGVMTETIEYRGSAIRKAWKCFNGTTTAAEKEWVPDGPLKGDNITILHYQVKGYGHGWPRLLLRKERDVLFKDVPVKLRGGSYFDTTEIILDFFKSHPLPAEFDQQEPLEITIPPEEVIQKEQDELDKSQDTNEELKERLRQLTEAHQKMKKINEQKSPESPKILKDEL